MIEEHIKNTDSKYVADILKNFDRSQFFKVLPNDYAKIIELIKMYKDSGSTNPELDAFNKFVEVR